MSVLVCYDGSPGSRRAISTARTALQDGDVTLLHVWSHSVPFLSDSFGDAGTQVETTLKDLDADAVTRAEEIVTEGQRLAAEAGLEVQTMIAPCAGTDWETILATADQLESDLIVVGTHRRDVPGPSLESTSDRVIEHSRRPVLVVPS